MHFIFNESKLWWVEEASACACVFGGRQGGRVDESVGGSGGFSYFPAASKSKDVELLWQEGHPLLSGANI